MLEVKDLKVFYGPVEAVKGISFRIETGQVVSLLGANGAGKTSTLKAILGLVRSSGRILFEGEDCGSWDSQRRLGRGIVLVPEGRGLFLNLTVLENWQVGVMGFRDRLTQWSQRLEQVLEEMFPDLKNKLHVPCGLLSGGQQQMVALARAWLQEPRLLLLDEPSMGLSPKLTQEVMAWLERLNRVYGLTILLVEQNLQMALKLSHWGYVLETGLLRFQGPASELLQDSQVVQAYLGGG